MLRPKTLITAICASLLCVNPSFAGTNGGSQKIASVGKYEVTKQEAALATKMAGLGEFDKLSVDTKKVVATRLLNDKAIEVEAKKEKLDEQTDVAMASRAILVSKYIEKHSGNLEVLAKKKYDETVGGLKGKKTYTLSHILVKEKSEALKLKKEIEFIGKKPNKNWLPEFKKLAKEKSIDAATAKNGGLVGSVPEMKLPEEFVTNIKDKKTNTLIGPFKTNLGYHIAFVEKVEPTHIEPYEKVKNVFIGQVFQEETERLAKENLKGKEVKFAFAAKE